MIRSPYSTDLRINVICGKMRGFICTELENSASKYVRRFDSLLYDPRLVALVKELALNYHNSVLQLIIWPPFYDNLDLNSLSPWHAN